MNWGGGLGNSCSSSPIPARTDPGQGSRARAGANPSTSPRSSRRTSPFPCSRVKTRSRLCLGQPLEQLGEKSRGKAGAPEERGQRAVNHGLTGITGITVPGGSTAGAQALGSTSGHSGMAWPAPGGPARLLPSPSHPSARVFSVRAPLRRSWERAGAASLRVVPTVHFLLPSPALGTALPGARGPAGPAPPACPAPSRLPPFGMT